MLPMRNMDLRPCGEVTSICYLSEADTPTTALRVHVGTVA